MEPIIGSITLFAFDWAPRGWMRCDGAVLQISTNSALFSLIGTTYGGDGATTFALPDLRGRAPIHDGQGTGLTPRMLGEAAGAETATLVASNIPPLPCTVQASGSATSKNPAGNVPAFNAEVAAYGTPDGTTMAATMVQTNSGGPTPVAIEPPVLAMNYCIAVQGIYPSRD